MPRTIIEFRLISNQEREELLPIMSDFHKEAYGFRPRGKDYNSMSLEQFSKEVQYYSQAMSDNEYRKSDEFYQLMIEEEKKEFEKELDFFFQLGAENRDQALKWHKESDDCDFFQEKINNPFGDEIYEKYFSLYEAA